MGKLLAMDRSVLDLPAFRAAQEKFESVMAEMQQYEATLVADWCSQVRCHGLTSRVVCAGVLPSAEHSACHVGLPECA